MRIRLIYLVILIPVLLLPACSQGRPDNSPVIADINGYKLTRADFLGQLKAEVEFDREFKVTREAKQEFLEQIIRRELLIQEAQRQRLDRQPKFVRAIERYWEATLIRDLLELKGEQIDQTLIVSQTDAQAHYEQLKSAGGYMPPLAEVRDGIMVELKESKRAQALDQWVAELRQNATVTIDEDNLFKD